MLNSHITYGTTRIVLLIGPLAIKFPIVIYGWRMFLLGLLANMQERQFSRTGWPELCPVLWSLPGGWLIVMRRAREMTALEFEQINLEQWIDRGEYIIPVEIKRNSFGWIDGKLVAVDYGN